MLRIGSLLHGYCGGHFGDSYSLKRVEAIGADWIVAREEGGRIVFTDSKPEDLEEYTKPSAQALCCSECSGQWDWTSR